MITVSVPAIISINRPRELAILTWVMEHPAECFWDSVGYEIVIFKDEADAIVFKLMFGL